MTKKKVVYLILLIILFSLILMYISSRDDFLFKEKKVYEFNVNYDKIQKKIDTKIKEYMEDKSVTIGNPKVILNPYNISSLSALIIFYTDYDTEIKLYVNDVFMTTMENSKYHAIPVYGLRENYKNIVKIVDNKNNIKEIYIETDKLNNNFDYEYKTLNDNNNYLFINSPKGKYVIDNDGYISWYMDVNKLGFDLTNDKRVVFIDKYNRIIETDFMGRVYRARDTDLYYDSHSIKKINNGNYIIINDYDDILILDDISGNILHNINIIDLLKNISDKLGIEEDFFYVNYLQYNENDNSALISVRGINTIINYDLTNNKIIWIFSNNKEISSSFSKYKLNLIIGDYFVGQHTPYLDGNLLYVFDNNNFLYGNPTATNLKKSSAVIYEIDGMIIKEIYRYNSEYSSGWYGSFFEKDGIKNINFGCIVGDELGNYSKMIEIDKKNNKVTDFSTNYASDINGCVYQTFREKFYKDVTKNYDITSLLSIEYNNNDDFLTQLNIKKENNYNGFINNLKNAGIDESMLTIFESKMYLNTEENFELLFVDSDFNFYKIDVTDELDYIADWNFYLNRFIAKLHGKYAIYLKINDKYYNTNMVFQIN